MKLPFTRIEFDLHFQWKKNPPAYRLYVNDEMFTERTYIWSGTQYLSEILQLEAPPGKYIIRIENLGKGTFKMRNLTCTVGSALILDNQTFQVLAA